MYIFALTLVASMAVLSCRKSPEQPDGMDIELEWPGYIAFEAPTGSKADNTVSSMEGLNFGVYAYSYKSSTSWNVYKATAKPMAEFDCPQTVRWNSTTSLHEYDASASNGGDGNLVKWKIGTEYTFFAFYPLVADSHGTIAYNTTRTSTNVPSITYTSPFTVGSTNSTDNMVDVMSAVVYNTDNSNSGTVAFTFKHRLSCFCVEARNFKDDNETLSDVKLTISSPIYKSASIPLDPASEITPGSLTEGNKTFQVVPSGESVTIVSSTNGSSASSSTTDLSRGRNIILIPQNKEVVGALKGTLTYKDSGGVERTTKEFEVPRTFESGKKYSIILSITSSAVSVAIIESGEWVDQDQDIFFE